MCSSRQLHHHRPQRRWRIDNPRRSQRASKKSLPGQTPASVYVSRVSKHAPLCSFETHVCNYLVQIHTFETIDDIDVYNGVICNIYQQRH